MVVFRVAAKYETEISTSPISCIILFSSKADTTGNSVR